MVSECEVAGGQGVGGSYQWISNIFASIMHIFSTVIRASQK